MSWLRSWASYTVCVAHVGPAKHKENLGQKQHFGRGNIAKEVTFDLDLEGGGNFYLT